MEAPELRQVSQADCGLSVLGEEGHRGVAKAPATCSRVLCILTTTQGGRFQASFKPKATGVERA